MVYRQGILVCCLPSRLQIAEYIGPAKGINSLLGIADVEHWLLARSVYRPENLVLHWVGVLEFINQRSGVAVSNDGC